MLMLIAWALGLLAVIGCGYALATAVAADRFRRNIRAVRKPVREEAVTLLKPLYGAEPRLAENLATFLDQRWRAPIQLVAGIQRLDDPAASAIGALRRQNNSANIVLVTNSRRHGANAKIGNLINMVPSAANDIIVLSDSDMAAPTDYLQRLAHTLAQPGVGAVTCIYRGRGDAGFWSKMGAAGLSYQFLPGVLASIALKAGDVCMGSTIAMRRETLERIGGFERFADILADDHAIGVAVRALGLKVAIAPMVVTHASTERSFVALARHELRWAATVRDLNPGGYIGMIAMMPVPIAVMSLIAVPGLATAMLLASAIGARLVAAHAIDRMANARTAPLWLLPIRDLLSFGIFVSSYFVRSVDWRGEQLRMAPQGRISVAGGVA